MLKYHSVAPLPPPLRVLVPHSSANGSSQPLLSSIVASGYGEGREGKFRSGQGRAPCIPSCVESIEHEQCLISLGPQKMVRLVDDDSYFPTSVKKITFKVL